MAEQKFVKYGDRVMPMDDGMTLEQAKSVMARHFPELAEPTVTTEKNGDKVTYVFSKKAGRKGGRRAPSGRRIRRLLRVAPTPIAPDGVVSFVAHANADLTEPVLQAGRLRAEAERTREIRQTLLDLPPAIPAAGDIL